MSIINQLPLRIIKKIINILAVIENNPVISPIFFSWVSRAIAAGLHIFQGESWHHSCYDSNRPAPRIEHIQVPPIASFNNVTVEEVSHILRKTPNKQCERDPMPTWLVKELCDVLAPIITSMVNASFIQGLFPNSHKHAVVRPRKRTYPTGQSWFALRPAGSLLFLSTRVTIHMFISWVVWELET